jgi:hypothetical protein
MRGLSYRAIAARLNEDLDASPPPQPVDPTRVLSLLDQLPLVAVDLNRLAANRPQRFLDAFSIEIHYDHRTRRAILRAEISASMIE